MNRVPLLRIVAISSAVTWFLCYSAAAVAVDMTLTFDGVSTPIEILSFKMGASNPIDSSGGGGGGTGKVAYDEILFTAAESSGSPLQLGWVNTGRHVKSAVLQVRSPNGKTMLSEWSFQDVILDLFGAESGPLDPKAKAVQTTFGLRFTQVCYKVFAADGSVATQTCFDLKTQQSS